MDALVLHPSRRGVAHTFFAIRLVIAVITLKPLHITVAFECNDMGRHPIQEPAIVGNNQCCTCEGSHCLFECSQRFDVKIIGGFVQQ